jgi:hypothetical protein
MMITKEKVLDTITVADNGTVLYREATRILENDVEISKTYHRTSLAPASDLTNVPDNVVAIANVAWTLEVIAAFQAQQEANKLGTA